MATHEKHRLGMIADDLTGACDAGVQFATRGFSTLVWLGLECIEETPAELMVVTTNSRGDTPEEAHRKVRQACQHFAQVQTTVFYKKIDSTFQGNVGAEIDAIIEECGFHLVIITPAFPAQGRSLIDGWLRISGAPQSDAIHLPTLLREQSCRGVGHLDRSVLRDGRQSLLEALRRITDAGVELVVVDAASEADLNLIARAAMEFAPRPLMAGSAGLAAQAAAILAQQRQKDKGCGSQIFDDGGETETNHEPIAVFVGSENPVTAAQMNRLTAKRAADEVQLGEGVAAKAHKALREKRHLVVPIQWKGDEARHLSQELLPLFKGKAVHGLVLTGGDTASFVFGVMEASGIRLEDEILTGIPWGLVVGGGADGLPVCTKAGGFGDEDALVTVVDFLAQLSPKLAGC
ncbi:MAG: four-carbon acid sugar kinase family protein [Candidatus Poribacteria bacterium]|nr:four-carbon acid sugar kinase family protein [Candidatus Poribacteria bacterium]